MGHFTRATDPALFACRCGRVACEAPAPDDRLVATLELVRQYYGRPISVTSGPRCAFWNEHEGGTPESAHLTGEAADLACALSSDRWDLLLAAQQAGVRRIGIGKTFVHVDVSRTQPPRVLWTYYS